ncbi:MAG: hypothetical protein HN780_08265 [Gemmatimonadetes bacterium]|nr:hypothetical protein [Gemmatimonadota bacterium]
MSYWTQKLKDFLTTDRENSLPKLTKDPFGSFGSEFPKQEEANNLLQPAPEEPPIAATDDGPANDPDLVFEADHLEPTHTRNTKVLHNSSTVAHYKAGTIAQYEIGRCWACRRSLWWKDRYGNKKCGICHPPADPDQIEWYDDQAEYFEERAAIIEHEAGLPQTVAEDLANKQVHRGNKRRKTQR